MWDVGIISERPEIQASLLSRGLRPITVRDVLRVVEGAITTGSPKNPNITKDSSYDGFSQSQIVLSFGMINKASTGTANEGWRDPTYEISSPVWHGFAHCH
jgi:hypothetical protein